METLLAETASSNPHRYEALRYVADGITVRHKHPFSLRPVRIEGQKHDFTIINHLHGKTILPIPYPTLLAHLRDIAHREEKVIDLAPLQRQMARNLRGSSAVAAPVPR